MRKEKRLIAGFILAAILAPMFIVLSAAVHPQEMDREKTEKYLGLAVEAKNKVDELMRVVEEIEGSGILSIYDRGNGKLSEAQVQIEGSEPNLSQVVDLAREAMADFRNAFKELVTIMLGEGVDVYEDEEANRLRTAVDRSHERINRIEELIAAIPPGIDVFEEEEYVMEARSELNEAIALLEGGRTTDADIKILKVNQLIAQASASMHDVAEMVNNQKIEAILSDLESFADEVEARLEEAKGKYGPSVVMWMKDLEGVYIEARESMNNSRTIFSTGDIGSTLREITEAREKLNSILETLEQRTGDSK